MAAPRDARVVALGAAVQIAVVVPPALLVSALRRDDLGAESNLWLLAAFLALAVGPAAAGVIVARRRPDSPILHAAVATAAAWALVAAVSLLRATMTDADLAVRLARLLPLAPIQVGIGVLGAIFSRPRSRAEETGP